jgi:hypothetical protein
MRMSLFRLTGMKPVVVLVLAWPGLTGCGNQDLVRVTGQVVEAGEPYRLADGETIQIDFSTADNAFPPLALGAFAKRDGSFVVDMNDGTGRGLPPGRYKIRLNREGTSLKKANAKLFKEAHVLEVTRATSPHLTIDLSKGTVTP